MPFSAATVYLACLAATLVVVVTSLSQPPGGISWGKNHPNDPFNHQAPKGCFGIGASPWKHDIGGKLVKRDSQSPETHAASLAPWIGRQFPLVCGSFYTPGQSDPFGFPTAANLALFWNVEGVLLEGQLIQIMRVVQNDPDVVVKQTLARYVGTQFKPIVGQLYYIAMAGIPGENMLLNWFFDYRYALLSTLPSAILADQAEQKS